ncbi:hypothetical protein B0J13DRAFT_552594 [Dactylonectria estremocensis]|uniref:T6SS Phospholipase effector Tle1-like catalytic domain-containing protein n=1 Tax=Dactylonectria estremocensis TaxID=1079267 RepID=A0A9P9EXE1_9HYPO|nr:hypothetical protein B0J13DRAFT_552594 [Dactylonectria estremocensis]
MAPRIVVLCDGTWCGRETNTETNIYRLARLFKVPIANPNSTDTYIRQVNPADPSGSQIVARYRHGVGLGAGFLDYLFDGATASDLKEEVILAYQFIVDHYTPNHEIWMFGLSRGAYTVRSVAGLINNYGIIDRAELNLNDAETYQICREAYDLYISRDSNNAPHAPDSVNFRRRNSWPLIGDPVPNGATPPQPPVRFMGLFDTVGSLGIPTFTGGLGLNYPEFYNDVVSSVVMNVYHLVSVHDRLWAFQPCLAKRGDGGAVGIYEEWLPGCHYDLGRQKFRFWRSGGGVLERFASIASYIPIIGYGRTVYPNLVLSDFALQKMLEQVWNNDTGNILLQQPPPIVLATPNFPITPGLIPHIPRSRLGNGDVYANILNYGPFGSLVGSLVTRIFGQLAIWKVLFELRDRVIPTENATVYRYDQADMSLLGGQNLDGLGNITGGGHRRYPSRTAESWALRSGQPWP